MDMRGSHQAAGVQMPIPMNYSALQESAKMKILTAATTNGEGDGCDNGGAGNGAVIGEEMNRLAEPAAAVPKKAVRYRECLKNYAAAIGGHAVDGCGEFMPSGEGGTLEALKCAACGCHRNFHRREVEGEAACYCGSPCSSKDRKRQLAAALALPPHHHAAQLALPSSPVMSRPTPQMIMALSSAPSESEEQDMGIPAQVSLAMHNSHLQGLTMAMPMPMMKKRFRTRFSSEQKDKMFAFAEKLGWRIQKHDEAMVQQFCMDVGVKRHVLKVWMHNNKNTLGKKNMLMEKFTPDPDISMDNHHHHLP